MTEDLSSGEWHRLKIRGSVALTTDMFERMALQNLRELDLSGCMGIGPRVLQVLSGSGVYRLTLKNMGTETRGLRLEDKRWINVGEGAMFPHLEVLDLSGNELLETIRVSAPELKILKIENCDKIKDMSLVHLIIQHEQLEEIEGNLESTKLAKELAERLPLSRATELNMGGNEIGAAGMAALARVLSSMPALTKLNLWGNDIGAAEVALARALSSLTALTSLGLKKTHIGAAGAAALARVLPSMTALTRLDLGWNRIDTAGVETLARVLPSLTALTALDLGNNDIGAAGMEMLAPVLPSMTALRELGLGTNDLGAAGVKTLARVLPSLTSLPKLYLGGNKIGAAGVKTLAPALSSLTALTALELGNNDIGAAGMEMLAPVLPSMTVLRELWLWSNDIRDAGAAALARVLPSMTALTGLDLGLNDIGDALKSEINAILEKHKRLQASKESESATGSSSGDSSFKTALVQQPSRLRLLDTLPQQIRETPVLPSFKGVPLVGVFVHSDMLPMMWFLSHALQTRSFASCFEGFAATGGLSLVPLASSRMPQVLKAYEDGIFSYVERTTLFPEKRRLSDFPKPVVIGYNPNSLEENIGFRSGEDSGKEDLDGETAPHAPLDVKHDSRWQARRALPSQIALQDRPVGDVLEEALRHAPALDLEQVYQEMRDELHTDRILFLQFGDHEGIKPHPSRVVLSMIPPSLQSKYEAFKGKNIDQGDLYREMDPFLDQLVNQLRTKELTLEAIRSEYLDPDDGQSLLKALRQGIIPEDLVTKERPLLREIVRRQKTDCFRAYRSFDERLSLEDVRDLEGGVRLLSPLWPLESIMSFPRTDPEVVRIIGLRLIEARDARIMEWGREVLPFVQAAWQKPGLRILIEDIRADKVNEALMDLLFPRGFDWETVRETLMEVLLEGDDTSDHARGTIKVIRTLGGKIGSIDYFRKTSKGMLQNAVLRGKTLLVRELLDNRLGDPLAVDENRYNALHHAVMRGHVPVVKELIGFVGRDGIGAKRAFVLEPLGDSPLDRVLRQMVTDPSKNEEVYHELVKVQEEGEKAEVLEEKRIITGDSKLEDFYKGFQRSLNQMLLAHQVMGTGLVEKHEEKGWLEVVLKGAGKNIPIPGAELVGSILSNAVGSYRGRKAEKATERAAGMYVSPVQMSEGVEDLARRLTFTYEKPLQVLAETEVFGESVAKRVLAYWTTYEGDVSAFENITTYLSTSEEGRIVGRLRRVLPTFVREFLLDETFVIIQDASRRTRKKQSVGEFLTRLGIKDETNTYTPTPAPAFYYRLGSRMEAERLGFYEGTVQLSGAAPLAPPATSLVDAGMAAIHGAVDEVVGSFVEEMAGLGAEDSEAVEKVVDSVHGGIDTAEAGVRERFNRRRAEDGGLGVVRESKKRCAIL